MTTELFAVHSIRGNDVLACPTQARKRDEAPRELEQAIASLSDPRGLCAEYCRSSDCTFRECHECGREMSPEDIMGTIGDSSPQCGICGDQGDWDAREDREIDGVGFADPGGRSALRAQTGGSYGRCPSCQCDVAETARWCACCGQKLNPRCFPCPSCEAPSVLTEADVLAGYQCDRCADRAEGRYGYADY